MFENADGIILRGEPIPQIVDGDLVSVATFDPDQVRVAKVVYRVKDGFVKLGNLLGIPGEFDCQLQWQRNIDVDLDSLQAIIIGGRAHYTLSP